MRLTLADFEMLEQSEDVKALGVVLGLDKLMERAQSAVDLNMLDPRLPAPITAEEDV